MLSPGRVQPRSTDFGQKGSTPRVCRDVDQARGPSLLEGSTKLGPASSKSTARDRPMLAHEFRRRLARPRPNSANRVPESAKHGLKPAKSGARIRPTLARISTTTSRPISSPEGPIHWARPDFGSGSDHIVGWFGSPNPAPRGTDARRSNGKTCCLEHERARMALNPFILLYFFQIWRSFATFMNLDCRPREPCERPKLDAQGADLCELGLFAWIWAELAFVGRARRGEPRCGSPGPCRPRKSDVSGVPGILRNPEFPNIQNIGLSGSMRPKIATARFVSARHAAGPVSSKPMQGDPASKRFGPLASMFGILGSHRVYKVRMVQAHLSPLRQPQESPIWSRFPTRSQGCRQCQPGLPAGRRCRGRGPRVLRPPRPPRRQRQQAQPRARPRTVRPAAAPDILGPRVQLDRLAAGASACTS